MLSQSLIDFSSRCSVTVTNTGDSSVLVLKTLPAGYRPTANSRFQLTQDSDLMPTRLVASLENFGTDCIENTTSQNFSMVASRVRFC